MKKSPTFLKLGAFSLSVFIQISWASTWVPTWSEDLETNPLTDIVSFEADGVEEVSGNRSMIKAMGGETAFLKEMLFKKSQNYPLYPLVQKKTGRDTGTLLGEAQNILTADEIDPKADFSFTAGNNKIFYKLINRSKDLKKTRVICWPRFRRIGEPPTKEEYPLAFPFSISTKKYGTIPYKCYATKGSPEVTKALEETIKRRRWNR